MLGLLRRIGSFLSVLASNEDTSRESEVRPVAPIAIPIFDHKRPFGDLLRNSDRVRIVEIPRLAIEYQDYDGALSRRIINVVAIGLSSAKDRMYIKAFCELRKDFRTFRVDKIASLTTADGDVKDAADVFFASQLFQDSTPAIGIQVNLVDAGSNIGEVVGCRIKMLRPEGRTAAETQLLALPLQKGDLVAFAVVHMNAGGFVLAARDRYGRMIFGGELEGGRGEFRSYGEAIEAGWTLCPDRRHERLVRLEDLTAGG